MLVSKDVTDKQQSVYKCDRCKAQLKWGSKVGLYIAFPKRTPKKTWDLCDKCFRSLVKGIEKK